MNSVFGFMMTGYPYFLENFREKDRDILEMRLLFNNIICMKGEEAAKVFYDTTRFQRKGIAPNWIKKTLFGVGGVQGLDDEAHQHRKAMFMKCMSPEGIKDLRNRFEHYWERSMKQWEKSDNIVLFKEAEKILCQAACEWINIPLPEEEVEKRTNQLSAMIDAPGAIGLRHFRGRLARKKAEHWLEDQIQMIRDQELKLPEEEHSIFYAFSYHRDLQGKLLDKKVVAVEILNLIRPIVAIARYIVFAALSLHRYPQYRQHLKENKKNFFLQFVQEVRRYYPFFPFVAAKARQSFQWQGFNFHKGQKVILDLYATNHDKRTWRNPDVFNPYRFEDWDESPFNFIPQGGGDHYHNHRCAGEWITIELTTAALIFLVKKMDYTVPDDQDLHIDMSRIPAIPKSRFIINNVKEKVVREPIVVS